jgi:dolichol-phosphate mannosyltransferase
LPGLVAALLNVAPDADILVVDDNSPDGTGRWCDQESARNRRLSCIHRPAKSGLGTATVAAMQHAIEHGYDYLVTMDADFSHDPKYVPLLLARMSTDGQPHVDVAIGSRYVPDGGTVNWGFQRRLISRSMNLYARWLLGLTPKDCSGAFRCYRVETLKKLDFTQVRSRGYAFQEEILYHLKGCGARFDEIPILFRDRERGRSKINLREATAALRIIFCLGVRGRLGM